MALILGGIAGFVFGVCLSLTFSCSTMINFLSFWLWTGLFSGTFLSKIAIWTGFSVSFFDGSGFLILVIFSCGFSLVESTSIKIFLFWLGFWVTCGIIFSCLLLEIIIVVGLSFSGFSVFLINFSGIAIGAFWILAACFSYCFSIGFSEIWFKSLICEGENGSNWLWICTFSLLVFISPKFETEFPETK
ncbi:hypothetical protein [Mesomycoplasma hyopneumoniae]|uniref:hypothetical protein n=1 Tax=Mesomycoplasma hyopneumoniae TaxID=2099 RepID=UPI00215D834A|nr:hypothetical protein [Mesomycoplasma hyopneumoniae]